MPEPEVTLNVTCEELEAIQWHCQQHRVFLTREETIVLIRIQRKCREAFERLNQAKVEADDTGMPPVKSSTQHILDAIQDDQRDMVTQVTGMGSRLTALELALIRRISAVEIEIARLKQMVVNPDPGYTPKEKE